MIVAFVVTMSGIPWRVSPERETTTSAAARPTAQALPARSGVLRRVAALDLGGRRVGHHHALLLRIGVAGPAREQAPRAAGAHPPLQRQRPRGGRLRARGRGRAPRGGAPPPRPPRPRRARPHPPP